MKHCTFLGPMIIAATLIVTGNGQSHQSDEEALRGLIKTFADARNAKNGEAAAAVYSEDGAWIGMKGRPTVKGRAALAHLWGGVIGEVQRTPQSIDRISESIAIVRVEYRGTAPKEASIVHHEAFIFVKSVGKWSLQLHQLTD